MIYVLSGGGTKLFAAIGVTYPPGSTCTCARINGAKTFTAKNTSGQWVFAVPEPGDWIVECTDGTNTKSKSVSIAAEGQFVSVSLVYWDGTIYDSGDEYTKYTGGWVTGGYKATTTDNVLHVEVYQTNATSWVRTADKISLADATAIEATITAQTHRSSWNGNERCKLVVSENEDLSSPVASAQPSTDDAQILKLPIETGSLTSTYYVGLWAGAGTASNASMTCSQIQLIGAT